jgi:effector-binding domain-containing protein
MGKMVITSFTDDKVALDLIFIKPWKSESKIQFLFSSNEGKTKITWAFQGNFSYPMNIMKLFINMDKQLGADFEKGLEKLKTALEKLPIKSEQNYAINEVELPTSTYIGKRSTLSFAAISDFYTQNLGVIFQSIKGKKLTMSGAPSGLFFSYDEQKGETDMAAAIPVKENTSIEGFESWSISGKALKITYYGDYNKVGPAHEAMDEYIKSHNLKMRIPVIEEYITDPMEEKDTSKWLTNIYYLVE